MVHSPANMASHDELVMEMATLEKMSVQERLKHARKRRAQQLKRYHQSDKEYIKRQRKNTNQMKELKKRKAVTFAKNVELLEAAARGDLEEVRHLLESGVDPDIGNEDGLTALHQSCIDNNEAIMRILVEKGADVNVTDRELWTPLHAASTCGHRQLAQFLISRGAHLLSINSDGNMPYDICEDDATLDYIESQMATKGITQEQIDELREVLPNEMLQGMQELYKNGEDLEYRDSVGATPLHIAVANGYDKVVQYLLSHNVDVAARDNDGWQPIHGAVCWAQADIITMLVESGADLDARTHNDETPISICEDEEIRTLIQQLKMDIQSNRIRPSNLVRRSSSRNKRGSSIRRSTKRDKDEMRKLDAKGEAAYMQSKTEPNLLEELENSTDEQITHIDDVEVTEEKTNGHLAQSEGTTEEKGSESEEEGRVTPMPVITEEPQDRPKSPRNKKTNGDVNGDGVQENGRTDSGDFEDSLIKAPSIAHQERLVSILKKRPNEEALKNEKSKKERKEEKEKERKEQKERDRMEKQRLKEEKAQRKKEKKKDGGSTGKEDAGEENEMHLTDRAGGESLPELKRLRSQNSAGGDASRAQDSGTRTFPAATHEKSKLGKGLRLPRTPRPQTGRYDIKVDIQGQNGDALGEEDRRDSATATGEEMKRFVGVPETVGEEQSRNCCIIS